MIDEKKLINLLRGYKLLISNEEGEQSFRGWVDVLMAGHDKGVRWRPIGEGIIWAAQKIDTQAERIEELERRLKVLWKWMSINDFARLMINEPDSKNWFDEKTGEVK